MQAPPFNEYLGTRLVGKDGGSVELAIDLQPHHLNRRGVAHGGVITALLDSALGAAVVDSMPEDWWCATTSLSTQFIGGATPGTITARGRVLHRGRRIAFAEGEARDAGGRLLARAHGTWHLWSHAPGSPRGRADRALLAGPAGERLRVGKIIAVGRNYADHAAEMGHAPGSPPVFFLKPSTALVPGGGIVPLPFDAGAVHYEVELVVAIGRPGRAIAEDQALDHVLGYAVGLDLTLRDLQTEAKREGAPWSMSKGFDGSAPVSALAARDAVGDTGGLTIELAINGRTVQSGNTSQMIHGVPHIIAEASRRMTLERGDLLFTGTPAGVGPLQPGDRLTARIDRVGTLEIVAESERD